MFWCPSADSGCGKCTGYNFRVLSMVCESMFCWFKDFYIQQPYNHIYTVYSVYTTIFIYIHRRAYTYTIWLEPYTWLDKIFIHIRVFSFTLSRSWTQIITCSLTAWNVSSISVYLKLLDTFRLRTAEKGWFECFVWVEPATLTKLERWISMDDHAASLALLSSDQGLGCQIVVGDAGSVYLG